MSQVPGFSLEIVRHLSDGEPSVFELNWMFFQNFTKYSKVLDEFFKKSGSTASAAGQELANLVDGENLLVLKKWVRFTTWVLKPPPGRGPVSQAVTVAWCGVLVEKLSRISILITQRHARFKDDEVMVQMLEELLSALLRVDVEEFVGKIQEHLLSMDARHQVKGKEKPPHSGLKGKKLSTYLQKSIVEGS
jgi:hypothetical protein